MTALKDEITKLNQLYKAEKTKSAKLSEELKELQKLISALHVEIQWCRTQLRRDVHKRMAELEPVS